jgi:hypothetical protein
MAKKKKLAHCDVATILRAEGVDFRKDVHAQSLSVMGRVAELARQAGYRKSKNAPGSTGRMYYQLLKRRCA